jgi:hypothetical protein
MGDDRAQWEGNTGADGVSRCEEWEGSAEAVLQGAFYRVGTATGERMREVIGRRRVDTINGDGSSKLKREWKGRWETGEAVTRLHLPVVRQRLEGCAVRQRWPNQQRRHGHQEAAAWPSA